MNKEQCFYDYVIRKDELKFKDQFHPYIIIDEDIISNIKDSFNLDNIQKYYIIVHKILNNIQAIQNGIVYKKGKDDNKIELENYKDYYHLIFEYDTNKLNQIKQILYKKYNIENVNLYQFDENNLIYIFDKDSNFEAKINSPLFSNLNNRINNYNKENLIFKEKTFLINDYFNYPKCKQIWEIYSSTRIITLKYYNNIFDQNWYNRFVQNMKLFLNNQLSK